MEFAFARAPEAVVAYFVKTFWQDVKQEAADKVQASYTLGFPFASIVILVLEDYMCLVHVKDATIGNGTAEHIPCQIVQNSILSDRKSTRLNSSHIPLSRMPSSA